MTRVGLGFDVHAFDPDRPLVLGGVTIPDAPGLAGHSDADVICHAVADALLGAARLGDLGERFPGNDRWKDASSLEILSTTVRAVVDAGYRLVNVDVSVVAERPRLSSHRDAMETALAVALGVERTDVSVKATTTDGLGFIGRAEGMAALAVALIEKN